MNVRAQIDLIDYQSMPDGPYNYVLDYQDHGIKFCQLRALTQRTHRAVALELIQIFCLFGQPSILQADNGKEFNHGTSKSCHVKVNEEVSPFLHTNRGHKNIWLTTCLLFGDLPCCADSI